MVVTLDRRTRKRLATRQVISDAATRLFLERGFDPVTVDEIAIAADVGRKTVFNHFPRKEDMFFDRIEEIREILLVALQRRESGVSPVEALRLLAHRLVSEQSYYVNFSAVSLGWASTIERSDTLKARARAIRDEMGLVIAVGLAESVGRDPSDSSALLASGLILATWTVALVQGHRIFQQSQEVEQAQAAFLALIDQGNIGLKAAMNGTPYV